MTIHRIFALFFFALVLSPWIAHPARADWAVLGAQYRCDAQTGVFTLLPHTESSGDETPPLKNGYSKLPDGDNRLACTLGSRRVNFDIEVFPPAARGMCMGAGYVRVNSITANGVELLNRDISFNWSCSSEEQAIIRLQVVNHASSVELKSCTAPAGSIDEFPESPLCSIESFDVDRMAAAEAKAAHHLADAKTQTRTSALLLATDYDLARVFGNASVDGRPMCTHWHAVFLNSMVDPEKQTYGRIAGRSGERVYLRRTHPALCATDQDDGCGKRAYVLPGDRVDVGFICGDWTLVQYRSRIRTKPPVMGWVETSRLYGLQKLPLIKADSEDEAPIDAAKIVDALARAAAAQDVVGVKALLAKGHQADGDAADGEPLFQATRVANAEIVRVLLQSGAKPDAHPPAGDSCRILREGLRNEDVFAALKQAGIDLDCRNGQMHQTVLMDIARYNRLWAWDRIHDQSHTPGERLIDPMLMAARLVRAGANLEVRDNWGQTALFYAMEPNNVDVAALLLSAGANPNVTIDANENGRLVARQIGSTPLMAAMAWYSLGLDPTMMELLLRHGANPNYRNSARYNAEWDSTTSGAVTYAGQTVLTRATQDGSYTLVRLMLEHGAEPTISREDGKTPVELAREYKHPEIEALIGRYVSASPRAQ